MNYFTPGVYFGMPDEQYFSVPALSASGVKWLRQSPLDYWARTSWLGKTEDSETEEESFAKTLGKSYHCRILEGSKEFAARYAAKFDPAWHDRALITAEEIRDALRAFKANNPEIRLTGKKEELIAQVIKENPQIQIMDELRAAYESDHAGKVFVAAKYLDKIELAAAMIEKSPTLGQAFKGGIPEVSIFWIDEQTGCPLKARIDFLKPKAIVDLKTFSNSLGREITTAVDREVANNRYAFQATQYIQAVDAAVRLMKEGKIYGSAPLSITEAIISVDPEDRKFLFVFQQVGPAPVVCGKVFNRHSAMYQICAAHLDSARRKYVEFSATFGTDPWIQDYPITELQDDEVPFWGTE